MSADKVHPPKGAHRHVADLLEVYVDSLRKGRVEDVEVEQLYNESTGRTTTVFRIVTGGDS